MTIQRAEPFLAKVCALLGIPLAAAEPEDQPATTVRQETTTPPPIQNPTAP